MKELYAASVIRPTEADVFAAVGTLVARLLEAIALGVAVGLVLPAWGIRAWKIEDR